MTLRVAQYLRRRVLRKGGGTGRFLDKQDHGYRIASSWIRKIPIRKSAQCKLNKFANFRLLSLLILEIMHSVSVTYSYISISSVHKCS